MTLKELEEKRKQTAIMKLTKGTSYYSMSLNNEFAYDDFTNCKKINIKGFKPLVNIDNWFIWKKKGESMYYCSFDYFKSKDRKHINKWNYGRTNTLTKEYGIFACI